MDIVNLIINKIGFVLFIVLIIYLIYNGIVFIYSEKHGNKKNYKKSTDEMIKEIEINKKYKEYDIFLKSNNFENKYNIEDNARELELCNEFIENNPDFNDMVLSHKIYLLIELKKYDEAFNNCKMLIKQNPDYDYHLAECYAGINNKEKAFELLENKYKKEEKDITYYVILGRIYFILKDYNKAIENFSAAIELNKSSEFGETVAPYYNRAKAYKEINDIEKYNSDMEKIKEIKENIRKRLDELQKQNQDN